MPHTIGVERVGHARVLDNSGSLPYCRPQAIVIGMLPPQPKLNKAQLCLNLNGQCGSDCFECPCCTHVRAIICTKLYPIVLRLSLIM